MLTLFGLCALASSLWPYANLVVLCNMAQIGPGACVSSVLSVHCRMGKVSVTHLATGDYEVQDVKCAKCSAHLGWTYLKAFNEVCIARALVYYRHCLPLLNQAMLVSIFSNGNTAEAIVI